MFLSDLDLAEVAGFPKDVIAQAQGLSDTLRLKIQVKENIKMTESYQLIQDLTSLSSQPKITAEKARE